MTTTIDASAGSEIDLAALVGSYGGPVSGALLASGCQYFCAPGVDGVMGYRHALACAVALGDPVCAPRDKPRLADAFRAHCRARRWHTLYAAAGVDFAGWAAGHGYAAVEFGEDLILDPRRDPQQGSAGRELRKKTGRARREGLEVQEYRAADGRDVALEHELQQVATAWRDGRHGAQIYLARVELFHGRATKRWLYARHAGRVVGVLALLRLGARDGYLLEHLLAVPDAPIGTTELLVADALTTLGREGCTFATFGPAPAPELGRVDGLSPFAARVARDVFRLSGRAFHLDDRTRYRRKFQVARTEPAYLLADPPRIGWRQVAGIMRAFNLSVT